METILFTLKEVLLNRLSGRRNVGLGKKKTTRYSDMKTLKEIVNGTSNVNKEIT